MSQSAAFLLYLHHYPKDKKPFPLYLLMVLQEYELHLHNSGLLPMPDQLQLQIEVILLFSLTTLQSYNAEPLVPCREWPKGKEGN